MAARVENRFEVLDDDADLLAIACNTERSEMDRLSAWREYEARCWFEALRERGFPFYSLPPQSVARVRELCDKHPLEN